MSDAPGWDREVDMLVLGSGAGGMAAAVTGAAAGLSVLLLEKTDLIGGSTAISGGVVWVPENSGMAAAGAADPPGAARRYLRGILGNRMRADMIDAYLAAAPQMVDFFNAETQVQLVPRMYAPDYRSEDDGASAGGRALDPLEFHGGSLGPWLARLRRPLPQMTIFGGMMVNRADIDHLLAARRSWRSFRHAARLLLRHARDRLRHPHGTRLLAGNALAARLLRSALDRGVAIETSAVVQALVVDGGAVTGADVSIKGDRQRIRARRGVVLATGGSAASVTFRAQAVPQPAHHRSMAPAGSTGDGAALALSAGGVIEAGNVNDVFLTPVSSFVARSGEETRFPHLILDRQKPGLIAVDQSGERFVNEADSYHDFVEAMYRTQAGRAEIAAWLICDAAFLARYGLGLVRPAPFPRRRFIAAGYLVEAPTISALAERIAVPPAALDATIARANDYARTGIDRDFGKGSTGYNRYLGDPDHKPNPCLGPIRTAPFYAVKIFPGDIGSTRGLRTDAQARVLDAADRPIRGLFACGNDMNSIMAGHYPAGGITLGPAMTFGFIAARTMAGETA